MKNTKRKRVDTRERISITTGLISKEAIESRAESLDLTVSQYIRNLVRADLRKLQREAA